MSSDSRLAHHELILEMHRHVDRGKATTCVQFLRSLDHPTAKGLFLPAGSPGARVTPVEVRHLNADPSRTESKNEVWLLIGLYRLGRRRFQNDEKPIECHAPVVILE